MSGGGGGLCAHTRPEAAALRPRCPQLLEHSQDLFIIGEGARCFYESASVRRTLGYSLIGCARHSELKAFRAGAACQLMRMRPDPPRAQGADAGLFAS